jgi:hypothetical protein
MTPAHDDEVASIGERSPADLIDLYDNLHMLAALVG